MVTAGLVVAEPLIGRALDAGSADPVLVGLVDFVLLSLFFWWSMHYLLHARVPWRVLLPGAVATALCWLGLGLFASLYFASILSR